MKILPKIVLTLIFFATMQYCFGQKQLSEGTLTYIISIQSAKNEKPVNSNLNGAELNVYLKPSQSRSEMKSTLGTETNVYDNSVKKGFILKEYSGQKLLISLTKENWAQKNQWNDDMKFVVSEELEKIGDYKCKKAVSSTMDGKSFTVYFAPDIVLSNKKYNNSFEQLPGLPVQYELKSGNLIFTYTLTGLSYEPVSAVKFEAPKTGFRMMTYEENQQLKKGE
ncbi:MAG: hypothetical protein ABIT07_11955 [Ferruginibacter sp.]